MSNSKNLFKGNHRKLIIPMLLSFFMALFGCKPVKDLPTVPKLDIQKYSGTWHEIARLPNSFEKGMDCVTATYSILENGKIEVWNKGIKKDKGNKLSEIKGSARVPDPNFPGRLKVTFFWPFAGDYYVFDLDENYEYALVGTPSRKFLWILGRSAQMDEATYTSLVEKARKQGFATQNLYRVNQDCN